MKKLKIKEICKVVGHYILKTALCVTGCFITILLGIALLMGVLPIININFGLAVGINTETHLIDMLAMWILPLIAINVAIGIMYYKVSIVVLKWFSKLK